MMKFPTSKGVATLVIRTVIIAECRRLEKKQMVKEDVPEEKGEVAVTEEVLVKPSFPDQLVTIDGGLSEAGKDQLKCLLKDNMGIFAWEPSDMTGVPRQIIEHALNVNPSLDLVCQKQRTFSIEKSGVVTNEVAEWVKMVEEDEEKTAFYTDQGTYCYTKMPFGLKNASATYQRLVDSKEVLVEVLNERSTESQEVHTIVEEEGDNWMTPIIQCLKEGIWPKDKNEARCLRAKISQYTVESGVLFKKGYLVPMLRCVGPLQANYVIREIHIGSCGMHIGPRQ
ncbi:hypothetical protein Tco_1482207 [Tanacetum coccineum]